MIFRCGHPWRCLPDDRSHAYWLALANLVECPDCIDRELEQEHIRKRLENPDGNRNPPDH